MNLDSPKHQQQLQQQSTNDLINLINLKQHQHQMSASELQQVAAAAAAVNQQLASGQPQTLQAPPAATVTVPSGGLGQQTGVSLPSSLDYILSLAVKQHQQQQLLQHQRQLQQLQHLQHLQQVQQSQQQQTQQRQANAAAVAAAAAAAFQQQQSQHHHNTTTAAAAATTITTTNNCNHHHSSNNNSNNHHHHQHNLNHQTAHQHHITSSQHRRHQSAAAASSYNPAATLHYLATNECRVIDYRGHRIAAFLSTPNPAMLAHLARAGHQTPKLNQSEHLLCLPQAFEVFLKHLVGGLHTVYTKLKRLDIVPIVCNVEQVRILRGLGAIQPGVNRCKLLSTHDFDILFKDCTTARPGRPPKRSPVGDLMSSTSNSPTRGDSHLRSRSSSPLRSPTASLGSPPTSAGHQSQLAEPHGAHHQLDLSAALGQQLGQANAHFAGLMGSPAAASQQHRQVAVASPPAAVAPNPLSALLDSSGLLAGKLAGPQSQAAATCPLQTGQQHQQAALLAAAKHQHHLQLFNATQAASSTNNNSANSNNNSNSNNNNNSNNNSTTTSANQQQPANILNDVWLLLALVQQQLNQVASGGQPVGAQQLLQQQLQAQLQLMQQQQQQQHQQQLAGAPSARPSPPGGQASHLEGDDTNEDANQLERRTDSPATVNINQLTGPASSTDKLVTRKNGRSSSSRSPSSSGSSAHSSKSSSRGSSPAGSLDGPRHSPAPQPDGHQEPLRRPGSPLRLAAQVDPIDARQTDERDSNGLEEEEEVEQEEEEFEREEEEEEEEDRKAVKSPQSNHSAGSAAPPDQQH